MRLNFVLEKEIFFNRLFRFSGRVNIFLELSGYVILFFGCSEEAREG